MKAKILFVAFIAAVMTASAQTPADKAALTKTELRKLIENTEWVAEGGGDHQFFFLRDGKIDSTAGWLRFYTVEAPDVLRIYPHDPKGDRGGIFTQFRVNVRAMVAEGDIAGSTKPGRWSMKYIGPAPKKYNRPNPKK